MKTKVQIIEETAAYYSEDVSRRSVIGNKCVYNGPDGRQCAFARVCEKPIDQREEGISAYSLVKNSGVQILKPDYQINDPDFWNTIQNLHDYEPYWNNSGMTELGKNRVKELKAKYKDN